MSNSVQLYQSQPIVPTTRALSESTVHHHSIVWLLHHGLASQSGRLLFAQLMLALKAILILVALYALTYLFDFLSIRQPTALTSPAQIGPIVAVIVAIIFLTILQSLAGSVAERYSTTVGRALGFQLYQTIFAHAHQLAPTIQNQRRMREILTHVTVDIRVLEEFFIHILPTLTSSLFTLIFALAILLYFSWIIALAGSLLLLLIGLLIHRFTPSIKQAVTKQQADELAYKDAIQLLLASPHWSQTFYAESEQLQHLAQLHQQNVAASLQTDKQRAQLTWASESGAALALTSVIGLGVWLFDASIFPVGKLLLCVLLVQSMLHPLHKLSGAKDILADMYASLTRINHFLDRKPSVINGPNALSAPAFQGQVEFQQVSFIGQSEPEESAVFSESGSTGLQTGLKEINFALDPDETLGIMGDGSSGHSVITRLLLRLNDPASGQILIDGRDIRKFTLESLRAQINVVRAEAPIFNGTVADNIANGLRNADRESIIAAAVQANAHGFIEDLAAGYDTQLGENGMMLSLSEQRRIMIARAFLRPTPILILDQPTRGLDSQATIAILPAIYALMQGKTTLLITQDHHLLRLADKVMVIKEGVSELLAKPQALRTITNESSTEENESIATEDNAPLAIATLHLFHSSALQQTFPATATIFDVEVMCTHFQTALFGEARDYYTVEGCTILEAIFLDGEGYHVRYELRVTEGVTGQTLTPTVLARVFPSLFAAEAYLRGRLAPLVTQMRGRGELTLFATPVALFEALNMVVHVFPIDGELPTLVTVTDRQRMLEVFRRTLPEAQSHRFRIEECQIEQNHYDSRQQHRLRYQVAGRWAGDQACDQQSIEGLVAADNRGEQTGPLILALRQWMLENHSAYHFNLPRVLGYRPDLQLLMVETVPGASQIVPLLITQLHGVMNSATGTLSLEKALETGARTIAILHSSGIELGPIRTFMNELRALQARLQPVWQFSPALAVQLQQSIKWLQTDIAQLEPLPLCISQGAFSPSTLLFEGTKGGLADFASFCQAEPALDLGHFQAQLRLAHYKIQNSPAPVPALVKPVTADQLCTHFLHAYGAALGYSTRGVAYLQVRAQAYEIISLVNMALDSWRAFQNNELEQILAILHERNASIMEAEHTANPRKTRLFWLPAAR